MLMKLRHLTILSVMISFSCNGIAADSETTLTRVQDVIYGRKHGTALTLDILRNPQKTNGKGVIWVLSGGWYSSKEKNLPVNPLIPVPELTRRGYTVFAVTHGSQPRYSIDDIQTDLHRAVRYIRHHALEYKIDPEKIGITGMSSGGHLSMMQATAGNAGDSNSADPVEKQSSRVQAVACFFPPTDFLNYGTTGTSILDFPPIKPFLGAFDFTQLDPQTRRFTAVSDQSQIREILKRCSPVEHATNDDPPTLIFHADGDPLVPYQQAQVLITKLKQAGVATKLVTRSGALHGWNTAEDMPELGAWFDSHLGK